MDIYTVSLILGLVTILAITVVLLYARQHGGGEAAFSLGDIFKATVKVEASEITASNDALGEAARRKGTSPRDVPVAAKPTDTRLVRLLWVDDHPDNNLFETIALERRGRFITKATSTAAALYYLEELPFAIAVTDLGRGDDPRAGVEFIKKARTRGYHIPIVVYTMLAGSVRQDALDAGAAAVVDTPHDLVDAVEREISAAVPQ